MGQKQASPRTRIPKRSKEPKPQQPDPEPELNFPSEGYNVSRTGYSNMPRPFLGRRISDIVVEFSNRHTSGVMITTENTLPNEVTLKLVFEIPYRGFNGVRVRVLADMSMSAIQIEGVPSQPGKLLVQPFDVSHQSVPTTRTCDLELAEGVTLHYIMAVVDSWGLQQFAFTVRDGQFRGCRDLMTQLLYRLATSEGLSGTITSTAPPGQTVYSTDIFAVLGMRFVREPLGKSFACPIVRGMFIGYERWGDYNMPYEASFAAAQLIHQMADLA